MAILTVASVDARLKFRDLLDTVFLGGQVVIKRNNKPTAVMVNYGQWAKLMEENERLRRVEDKLLARQRYAEMKVDPTQIVTEDQYQQMLKDAGLEE